MDTVKRQIEENGYALVRNFLSSDLLRDLESVFNSDEHGIRNLLSNPAIRRFAGCEEVRRPILPVLGRDCFAERGIFFNKNSKANWNVTWHQDCVIAVCEKINIEGWGPWSNKAGVIHVRPTPAVLERMIAIRIHLDDCSDDNGALRVIPGSHLAGFLSDDEIRHRSKEAAVICAVCRGDAILMRPLLLHSSPPAKTPSNRRVVHLEFAAEELPYGAKWHDRIPDKTLGDDKTALHDQ